MNPHILYIEDDAIDSMAFKRQMVNQNYFTSTIVNNLDKIDKSHIYEIVICDANFTKGNYIDAVNFFSSQKIIIVSGTPIPNIDNVYFFQKPFLFDEIIKSIYSLNFEKINEMSVDDDEFKNELTQLAFSELEINYNNLHQSIINNDINEIAFIAHKFKSVFNLLKIPCIAELEFLEQLPKSKEVNNIKYFFSTISLCVHIALYQFKIQKNN